MRRTHPNKQGAGGTTTVATSTYALSAGREPLVTTTTSSSRRRSLALGENPAAGGGSFYATPHPPAHRSLQGDELRAHLGILHTTPPPAAAGSGFEQYENVYEKARSGLLLQGAVAPSSVFGSNEADGRASERRRRLSMGSQMELIQAHVDNHAQARPKSFMMPPTTETRGESLAIRTAPSSRANSAPKVRPLEGTQNPYQPGTARALQFDRVSESLPNFKPSEVKPDFFREDYESRTPRAAPAQSVSEFHHLHPISKSESHTPIPRSPKSGKHTPTKYLNARAVAERLAKAIRGNPKISKNKVDTKVSLPSGTATAEAPGALYDGSRYGKAVDPWPAEVYSHHFVSEQAMDHSGIVAEFDENSQITSFRERKLQIVPHEEREVDMLKSLLEGMKQQSEGAHDDLERKAQAACERLEMLDEEQVLLDDQLFYLSEIQSKDYVDRFRNGDPMAVVQQRLRKMHEEKKHLALEAASELRRRISERAAARKVFTLMKREMDAYAKVMEKEKAELQTNLEDEIARRESSWVMKLDKIRAEERELRERVMNLQEENSFIQREISTMSSKDGSFKEKVKELEYEVDSYRTRAEQAEAELDALHKAMAEKEAENRNLQRIVGRLPQLCGDYDKRANTLQQNLKDGRFEDVGVGRKPSKLQRELLRLSSLEVALRSEMQALKGDVLGGYRDRDDAGALEGVKSSEELCGEVDRLQKQVVELQDENNLLCVKLRLAVREKEEMKQALREAEDEIQELRGRVRRGHGGEADQLIHGFQRLRMDEGNELEGDADSQLLELEGRAEFEKPMRQLNGKHVTAEAAMSDQLQARESQLLTMKHEFGKQEDTIRGLEYSLSVAGKTVEAQKARIMRLSTRNEELVRLYHSKESEVQDLRVLSSAEAESRKICEQELSQLKEQAMKCKQDLRAQDLNCKLLKEKLGSKEAELEQRNDEVTALEQRRDWLETEVQKLQRLLGDANQKASSLEHQVEDQREKIKKLQTDADGHAKELTMLKAQLPRVLKERDELSHEAEQMGREALKLSAEVEVLRRKVHELDEDVMVRDGQISILCNSLEDRE